ncbi:hypothetical protein [Streptomyces atacamensis]|jgi:hypothetical protein|uniref:hypothetical protein n=1 Tax=Streptomyces atacamensis TaxID=531966 RepID=UPI00399C8E31
MSETSLVTTATASPRIEYRQFLLRDEEAPHHSARLRPGHITHPTPHAVVFTTGGNDFYPEVRIEVWTSRPPHSDDQWETVETADFAAPSGRVRVREWDQGPAGDGIDLGAPGTYRLRAYCRGRTEAAARVGQDLYYHGIEEWLLQLWPACSDTATQSDRGTENSFH